MGLQGPLGQHPAAQVTVHRVLGCDARSRCPRHLRKSTGGRLQRRHHQSAKAAQATQPLRCPRPRQLRQRALGAWRRRSGRRGLCHGSWPCPFPTRQTTRGTTTSRAAKVASAQNSSRFEQDIWTRPSSSSSGQPDKVSCAPSERQPAVASATVAVPKRLPLTHFWRSAGIPSYTVSHFFIEHCQGASKGGMCTRWEKCAQQA